MADEIRKIKIRRGLASDFNPEKMTAGELAINTDDGVVHVCYRDGVCKDLVSTDDVASTTRHGVVQLTSSINSESESTAATPKAVKQAYDRANESITNITIGASATPLTKTNGAVNVPAATSSTAGIMTADQAAELSRLSKNVVPIANKRYATFHYPAKNYLFGAIGVIRLGATSVSLISANGMSNLYTSDSNLRVYAGESYLQIIFPDNYTNALLLVGGSLSGYTSLEVGTT